MPFGVRVVAHVALLFREYGVVASHVAVFAGEPERAALAKYDGAGDDKFGGPSFGAESFARALGGFVGAALGGVRCGACVVEGEEG